MKDVKGEMEDSIWIRLHLASLALALLLFVLLLPLF